MKMIRVDIASGTSTTIGAFIMGILPTFTHETKDEWIFWFQILAFTTSIVVGCLTAWHLCTKLSDRNKKKKNEHS